MIGFQTNIEGRVRSSARLIRLIRDWDILVLVLIITQGKGPEQHMHVEISHIDRPWGSLPHFSPFNSLADWATFIIVKQSQPLNVVGRHHFAPSTTKSVASFYSVCHSYCSEEWIWEDGNSRLRSLYSSCPYCFRPEPHTRTYWSTFGSAETIGRRRDCLGGIFILLCYRTRGQWISPFYYIGSHGRSPT
jgi:hypothetical protein